MIKVSQVTKRINGKYALEHVDLEAKDGQILGLVGPNGAGKTTLLNIIAGIWPADEGTVQIDAIDVAAGGKEARRKVGYVPDAPFLYPLLTGREFLSFVGKLYAMEERRLNQRITELGKALELSYWLEELMEGYPRGVRQKMTLAGMILHSPKTLLLDEPLTNLDPKSSKVVKELLQTMASGGATVVLSTHILEIAEKLCQRVVIIHEGRKIAEGSVAELKRLARGPASNLEEIFLQLTGGEKYTELLKYLA